MQKHPAGTLTILESGKKIPADTVLYSAGRQGVTDELNIAAAGLSASNRGRIEVNEHFQTDVEHIYAVGDVIGFPALAATAMEQGRRASYHAFGEPVGSKLGDLQPIGIYTIPEISLRRSHRRGADQGQRALRGRDVPLPELARGAILGDSYGMLKILVHGESRELLGVHVFGTNATELVHIGQTVMGCGGTVDYLVDAVFNYPTLAESYKVAALDAVNKMRAIAKVTQTGELPAAPGIAAVHRFVGLASRSGRAITEPTESKSFAGTEIASLQVGQSRPLADPSCRRGTAPCGIPVSVCRD